eukprot:XP_001689818.1 predicted protein [Chlamydomonas reinhardtii]
MSFSGSALFATMHDRITTSERAAQPTHSIYGLGHASKTAKTQYSRSAEQARGTNTQAAVCGCGCTGALAPGPPAEACMYPQICRATYNKHRTLTTL